MKKVLSVFFAVILAICAFSVTAFAEELQAPVVQFKLVNHDEIALRWDEVKGADYYRIYRTDAATGKTVKYNNPIKKTETSIKGLTAETDYIFKVAAVSEKDGEIIAEVKSVGTHVTTPKEWYYSYSATTKNSRWIYKYFKENYSKTIHTDIKLDNINSVDELVYSDGWIYFISMFHIGRIREDGTGEEILFDDFGIGEGWNYRYKIHDDNMYLFRSLFVNYGENTKTEIDDYHKISLKTGEVSKICDVFESSFAFDIYNDYVYFIYYPLEYDEETEKYSDWNGGTYLCRAKIDGTGKEIICRFPVKNIDFSASEMYIYDDEIYFYSKDNNRKIYKTSINGGEVQEIFSSNVSLYITDFEIVNGYIYFTNHKNNHNRYNWEQFNDNTEKPKAYYRLKLDGTGLTKQKKPFEWKY